MEIILIVIIIILVVAGLLNVYYLNKKVEQKFTFVTSLQKEISRISELTAANQNKVQSLYHQMRQVEGRIDQLSLKEPSQQMYRHAVKLVKSGACINDVVESCGLSRGEAELIMLLNKMGTGETGVWKNDIG